MLDSEAMTLINDKDEETEIRERVLILEDMVFPIYEDEEETEE